MAEAATSLGSLMSNTRALRGKAAARYGAPIEPFGSLTTIQSPSSAPGVGNPRDKAADPFKPRLRVRVSHHEIPAPKAFLTRPRVEIPKELAHEGLVPQPSTCYVPHHGGKPRAAAAPRAENPHEPVRSEFVHDLHCGGWGRERQSPRKA